MFLALHRSMMPTMICITLDVRILFVGKYFVKTSTRSLTSSHCIAQLRIGRNTFAQCPLCQLPLMIKDESSFRSLNDVRQRAVDLYRALTCQMDGNYSQEQLNETLRIMHENAPQRTVDDFKKECQLKIDDDNTVTPKIGLHNTTK